MYVADTIKAQAREIVLYTSHVLLCALCNNQQPIVFCNRMRVGLPCKHHRSTHRRYHDIVCWKLSHRGSLTATPYLGRLRLWRPSCILGLEGVTLFLGVRVCVCVFLDSPVPTTSGFLILQLTFSSSQIY